MKKVIGLVLGLVPLSVSAECVPSPDCASIGYTETSCEGDSIKCPFDTTKLKCIPCDSSFRYSCDGENIKNPIGNACNNKYVACECEDRTTFVNGECVCDTSCDVIGNIYYSDGTCSSCNLTDKTPVGIIIYNDSLTDEELANYTDVASIFHNKGYNVRLVKGSDNNIKITTPFDLAVAQAIIANSN